MTLAELRTYVRDMIGEDTAAWFTDAALNRWINASYRSLYSQIVEANELHFLSTSTSFNLVAGTETYALPSDFYRLVSLYRIDQSEEFPLSPIDLNQRWRYLNSSGFDPVDMRYYLTGMNIGLVPIPQQASTAAIRLYYVPRVTALSADGDSPAAGFPTDHHEAIAWGAILRASTRDKEMLPQYAAIYGELKTALINAVEVRQVQEPQHIVDVDTD